MAAHFEMETDGELEYGVHARAEREVHRLPRSYSPRYEKQRAPQGAHNGAHRRGRRSDIVCHAA